MIKRIGCALAIWLVASMAGAQALPGGDGPVVVYPSGSGITVPNFTGQWTVNGSLCAAGQVVQGGNPTLCTSTPTLGVATTTAGTIGLAKGAGGGAVWTIASAATSNWTLTGKATAPAQGDLFTFSNATGQMSTIAGVTAGSYLRSAGTSTVPVWSTVTLPNTAAAATYLVASATNVVSAVAMATTQTSDLTPSGTTSATGVMMGIGLTGATITPTGTGRVTLIVQGRVNNNGTAAAEACTIGLRYGTGTAPSNGAALTGTLAGTQAVAAIDVVTVAGFTVPFTIPFTLNGLTLSTAVWFDVGVISANGGTCALHVSASANEY